MSRSIMKMDWRALGYQSRYQIVNNNITVIWENMTAISEAKSAAKRETMNSAEFDEEYDLDRSIRLKRTIEQVFEENEELLERLGND